MLASAGWDISPGDFVEITTGRRGTVLETVKTNTGALLAVNVGFDWFDAQEIISWVAKN